MQLKNVKWNPNCKGQVAALAPADTNCLILLILLMTLA
jgi:hypothetical protein